MRHVLALALIAAVAFSAAAAAATKPNVRVTLVVQASGQCNGDMPCDPPIGSYSIMFSRTGAMPIRLRVSGPGTVWTHLRPGLYVTKVRSMRTGETGRVMPIRVRSSGITVVRLAVSS